MQDWRLDSPDSEASFEIASELGRAIGEPGLVIGLSGPLGAGKTVFVKGLAAGLGVDARLVSSPTFVIAQQYPLLEGPRVLHHLDFYRLESVEELEPIGFADFFARGCVLAVEWADRFPGVLGAEWLQVEIEGPSIGPPEDDRGEGWEEAMPPARRIRVRAHGPEARRVCADWATRVGRLDLGQRAASGESVAAESGADARSGAPGDSTRTRALLLLAAGMAGLAGGEGAAPLPLCRQPEVLASDAWGALRIGCDGAPGALPVDAGLGGLLLGRAIDLNRASGAVLEALPGIGPVRAQAILSERARAPFESLAAVERVSGIGPRLRARLTDWTRVDPVPDPRPGDAMAGEARPTSAMRSHEVGGHERAGAERPGAGDGAPEDG